VFIGFCRKYTKEGELIFLPLHPLWFPSFSCLSYRVDYFKPIKLHALHWHSFTYRINHGRTSYPGNITTFPRIDALYDWHLSCTTSTRFRSPFQRFIGIAMAYGPAAWRLRTVPYRPPAGKGNSVQWNCTQHSGHPTALSIPCPNAHWKAHRRLSDRVLAKPRVLPGLIAAATRRRSGQRVPDLATSLCTK